jgi:adenylate kinase family enzyme
MTKSRPSPPSQLPDNLKRIAVLGTTGAGKSHLAGRLSELLGAPHIEFDRYRFDSDWTMVSDKTYRGRLAEALNGDCWVADGNAPVARDIVWSRATMLVHLDYSISRVLWRLLLRTIRRVATRQRLWNGNRERLRTQLLTGDSLFLYALKTHWRFRNAIASDIRSPEYARLRVMRFHSPRETERWLGSMTSRPNVV